MLPNEGVDYYYLSPYTGGPQPTRDAVLAAKVFFSSDAPNRPCLLQYFVSGSGFARTMSPADLADAARQSIDTMRGRAADEARALLCDSQAEWLHRQFSAAATAGAPPAGAARAAVRAWAVQIGGAPPSQALAALVSRAQQPSGQGESEVVRTAWSRVDAAAIAESIQRALANEGRTVDITPNGVGPVPTDEMQRHWLTLAACGSGDDRVDQATAWYLRQAVQGDPALQTQMQHMQQAGIPGERAQLFAEAALTLETAQPAKPSSEPGQAARLIDELVADPAAAERLDAAAVRRGQEHLACLAGQAAVGPETALRPALARAASALLQDLSVRATTPQAALKSGVAAFTRLARKLAAPNFARQPAAEAQAMRRKQTPAPHNFPPPPTPPHGYRP